MHSINADLLVNTAHLHKYTQWFMVENDPLWIRSEPFSKSIQYANVTVVGILYSYQIINQSFDMEDSALPRTIGPLSIVLYWLE